MNKILTIIGARPQFIKAGAVSRVLKASGSIDELVLHTGQHYDANMSDVFFGQLGMPKPDVQLNINGGNHGEMTGLMLAEIEKTILEHKPDRILVYGDTNSTLAGALAAAKLHVPVAHVEAGLRSFNMKMPEEINRILTDQLSDQLFCPTDAAINNLGREGYREKDVFMSKVGDVMQDAALFYKRFSRPPLDSDIPDSFVLATLHRAENTDDPNRLKSIVAALNEVNSSIAPVIVPLHPRTKSKIDKLRLKVSFEVIEPVGYFEMLWLLEQTELVLTDSGGVQKEAFFFNKACVTMRDQTEWVELIDAGVNELVGADSLAIVASVRKQYGRRVSDNNELYGGGKASKRIVESLFS